MSVSDVNPAEVVEFWRKAGPQRWFAAEPDFDAECRQFREAVRAAGAGSFGFWREEPVGALALVLLLDQLPRNLFRASAQAYASDPMALAEAARAIQAGHDLAIEAQLRTFFYLPFTHAEDSVAQKAGVRLYERLGDAEALGWARHHHDVVARFGRFPHRNSVLGRESTAEELAFLAVDDFRG